MARAERLFLLVLFVLLATAWGGMLLLMARTADHPQANLSASGFVAQAIRGASNQVVLPATWTVTPTPSPRPSPSWTPSPTVVPPTLSPTSWPLERPTRVALSVTYQHPSSTLAIPTPVPVQPIAEGAITILLLGSDRRPDWEDWHTDAIQYVVIHPQIPSVAILSIPRDLYVLVPGFWMSRINFADMYGENYDYEDGGLGLLNQTLLHNLGISADYYVKVDFDGLIGLVDTLGGIDVPVHCRLRDYWPYPDEEGNYHQIILEPGMHHMDGELALWYSRSRKTTDVFSREARQQQVLEAMWRKAMERGLWETIPSLYEGTANLYATDLTLGEIVPLAISASQLDRANLRHYAIGADDVIPYITPYGGSVFLPDWEQIAPIIADVLAAPAASRAARDRVWVEVSNATEHADWDLLVADRLYNLGYVPVIESTDEHSQAQTQMILFKENLKGLGLPLLQQTFGVRDEDIMHEPQADAAVALRMLIGEDYTSCSN
jgi:LCP family protein required for cell wall assembly